MTQTLKIDFVSDIVCPWCAVGLGALEQALEKVGPEIGADIHFQPFELNPQMAPEGENVFEHIGKKYGSTREQSAKSREMIAARGAEVGFAFNYGDDSRIWNTFDAHRLLHWAQGEEPGKQAALKKALLKANFTDQMNPSDHAVLAGIAEGVGLDRARAEAVLASDEFAREVREREVFYQRAGITGVPAVIIEDRYLISGGQPAEVFERALRKIAAEKEAAPA
jgi:predicted DsbA family dithiol-disulfide isomerase